MMHFSDFRTLGYALGPILLRHFWSDLKNNLTVKFSDFFYVGQYK